MQDKIKLSSDQLKMMSMFQEISGAMAKDCVVDEKMNRVIFIVNKGEMGLAIGKNGQSIKNIKKSIGQDVDLVEYSDDPVELIANSLNPKLVKNIRLTEKPDGLKTAIVSVDDSKKGEIVGRNGKNAERARLLAKRYFQITTLQIINSEESQ
tara:strand:+ start:777 stop:1232 length:456 start_codon:yes stop_codon:yes gene_type:complete